MAASPFFIPKRTGCSFLFLEQTVTVVLMQEFLTIAKQAALTSGEQIVLAAQHIDALNVEQKSLNDYVSEVDRRSEVTIKQLISDHYPTHAILGEEYGVQGDNESEYRWIIDPLDGTTNFLRSIPHYAVSIALERREKIICGVVYDPIKYEMFSACRGSGAFLNEQRLNVSQSNGIGGALLATGVPFNGDNLAQLNKFSQSMCALLELQTSGLRRLGSAALDLAYVAAGRYDGYWEAMLNSWDIAAGVLLVEEAGGVVSDLHGSDQYLQSGDVLAANPAVHKDMLDVTMKYY